MTRWFGRASMVLAGCLLLGWSLSTSAPGQGPKAADSADAADLADYRTVEQAISARISKAASGPVTLPAYLGIHAKNEGGSLTITLVHGDSPAARCGLQPGDVLSRVEGKTLATPEALREFLQGKSSGDKVSLNVVRRSKPLEMTATLGSTSRPLSPSSAKSPGPGTKKGAAPLSEVQPLWKKDVYRLAVVPVAFADIKLNENITATHWDEALFSRNTHVDKKNVTGQQVYGSLNDYYQDQSHGKLRIEGKVFEPVAMGKKRGDYYQGAGGGNKTALLSQVLDRLIARDGKEALKGFDGVCFLYAGNRVQTNRGSLYYPHQGAVSFQGKRWPYVVCPEGGNRMETISVFAPEVGRLLGLPELFARPESAGSEGLGPWCLMSNGAGEKGKPGHLSAWCKEQLGWLQPTVIDPSTRQKLILAPVQSSPRECIKVLVRLDGSEYLLLENRLATGFDADLPGQGMLIWRVAGGRPVLEEAHGVSGPTGPRVYLDAVPYPSKANNAFTPFTTPSSRSLVGGGLAVHLTSIRRLPDGRVTFLVGYEYF